MGVKEYTRTEIEQFKKITDLFIKQDKWVNAELLLTDSNQKIYLREWYPAHSNYAKECTEVDTFEELEAKLKEEEQAGIISANDVTSICNKLKDMGIY